MATPTTTYPIATRPSPYTSVTSVIPSSWAHTASSPASLLPSPSSSPPTSPLYYSTASDGATTTFALVQPATTYTTVTSVAPDGQTWVVPLAVVPTASAAAGSGGGSGGTNRTVTIVLSTVVTLVGLAAVAIVMLLVCRGRIRSRQRRLWARYPSQWSWDAKYHDTEPTPMEPTSPTYADPSGSPATPTAYAFAPSYAPQHARFPSSDLPRTAQPNAPPAAHQRQRSVG